MEKESKNNSIRSKNNKINYYSPEVERVLLDAVKTFQFNISTMLFNGKCDIFLYLREKLGLNKRKNQERDQIKILRNHLIRLTQNLNVNEPNANNHDLLNSIPNDIVFNNQTSEYLSDIPPLSSQAVENFTKYSLNNTLQPNSSQSDQSVEQSNLSKINENATYMLSPTNDIQPSNSPIIANTDYVTLPNRSVDITSSENVEEFISENEIENKIDDENCDVGSIALRNNRTHFIENNFHPNGQTYTLTRELFNKVTDPKTKTFKYYNSTANERKKTKDLNTKKEIVSFHQLVREITSCYIYFHNTIYRYDFPYRTITVKAYCKYKVCKRFMLRATFLIMGEDDIIFTIFQDLDEINHPYEMCNQVRDVNRVLIAEQAIAKGSKNVTRSNIEAFAERAEDFEHNKDLKNLSSDEVVRKIKSQFCLESLRHPDPWKSLTKMWRDDDLLAFLDYGPLFVGFICDDQIAVIINASAHGKKGLDCSFDATGSAFAEPRTDMLLEREKVFMYTLITRIRCNDTDNSLMPFPICVMFTTCHTTLNIRIMLIKMIDRIQMRTTRKLYTIIRTVTVDFAMAGINALCLACNMMELVEYLQQCAQYIDNMSKNPNLEIKLVIIRLCTSHVAKILYNLIDNYITDPADNDRLNLRRIFSSIHDIRDCDEVYALFVRLWKYLIAETPEEKKSMYVALKTHFDHPEIEAKDQPSEFEDLDDADDIDDNCKTIYSQSPFYQRGFSEFQDIIVQKFYSLEQFSFSHPATFNFITTFLRRIVTFLPMLIPTLWYEEFEDLDDEAKKTANRANNGLIEGYHKDVKDDIKKNRIVGTIPIRIDAYADHIYKKDLIPKIIAAKMKIPRNRTSRNINSAGKIAKKRLSKTPSSATRKLNVKNKPSTPKTPKTPRFTKYTSPSIASSISTVKNDKIANMRISQIKKSKESYGKRSLRWEQDGPRKKTTLFRQNLFSVDQMEHQFKNNKENLKFNSNQPVAIGEISPIAVSTPVSVQGINLLISQNDEKDSKTDNKRLLTTIEEEITSLDLKPLKLPKPFLPASSNLEEDLNNLIDESKPKSKIYDKSTVLMTTVQLEQSARLLGFRSGSILSFCGFDTFFDNYVYSALPYYTENDPSDCDFLTMLVKGKFKLFYGDLKTIWKAPKWTCWFSNYLVEFSLNFLVMHHSIDCKVVPIIQSCALFKMTDETLLPSISNINYEDKKNFVLKYFKQSLIFLPILFKSHFMIAVIDKNKGSFNFFDSYKSRQPDAMRTKLLKNIKEIVDEFKDNLELNNVYISLVSLTTGSIKINKQNDSCHCGPHVINNAELYMLNKPLYDKHFNPIEFRQNLLRRLLEFSDDVTNLCPQCGDNRAECTEEKFWLECEKCARWYHSTCVDESASLLVHLDIRLFVCKMCNQCSVFK